MSKKQVLALLCIILTASCNMKNEPTTSFNLAQFLEETYQGQLELNPLQATMAGMEGFNHQFPNFISEEYRAKQKNFYTAIIDTLQSIDQSGLNDNDLVSLEILHWESEIALSELKFPTHLTPIDQMWSVNLMIGQWASGSSTQPFETVKDYENWLKRVDAYLVWCDTAIANMRKGIQEGVVLPTSLIEKVIPQFKELAYENLDDHLFYSPIKNMPSTFTTKQKLDLSTAYNLMVMQRVIPKYRRMTQFLEQEYLPAGRATSGVNELSFGKEYYDHMIKKYTTTDMTADQIHKLGLKEVKRLKREMKKVKKRIGYEGDLNAFFEYVRNNKELMPFKDPQEVIDNFNDIHQRMIPQLEKLFSFTPKTPFEVRRTEAFRESSASAEYNPGSVDGTRPGVFYVPIPDVEKYNTYSDEDLFLHEAIPGHHYQISLQQENEKLPEFRKTLWYSAYGEGWALYCESLGKELGLYKDPYQYFGMLGMEMHRAIRLVVDTGLHAKGWSREKAIAYSLENEAESEASIISEIERYMAMPGQALSYKIGQLKIMELRAFAEDEMKDKFDIQEFHRIVLEAGCIPLETLEKRINTWVSNNAPG